MGGLGTVSGAPALAFARVFAFATVVACLTSAFAFAGVLSLASVFFLHLVLGLVLLRTQPGEKVRCLDRCTCTGKQTGKGCTSHQHFLFVCHQFSLAPIQDFEIGRLFPPLESPTGATRRKKLIRPIQRSREDLQSQGYPESRWDYESSLNRRECDPDVSERFHDPQAIYFL